MKFYCATGKNSAGVREFVGHVHYCNKHIADSIKFEATLGDDNLYREHTELCASVWHGKLPITNEFTWHMVRYDSDHIFRWREYAKELHGEITSDGYQFKVTFPDQSMAWVTEDTWHGKMCGDVQDHEPLLPFTN